MLEGCVVKIDLVQITENFIDLKKLCDCVVCVST